MAYNRLEPFGEERADYRSATIACVIANVNRVKGQKAFKVTDFMPRFDAEPVDKNELLLQKMKQISAMLGGKVGNSS